jgi:hypothetical protein
MKKLLILSLILFGLSCEKTEILNSADQISKIEFQISGLNAPGDSVWYECWLMWKTGEGDNVKNVFESVGLLTNNSGNEYSKTINVNPGYIQKALHLVITIEEDTYPGFRLVPNATSYDTLKGPSIYKIIAAKIVANTGSFNVGNEIILDFDFETAQAKYILATPTDTTNTNLKRGLWFIALDTTYSEIKDSTGTVIGIDTTVERLNGLELPELPENWLYEGWIVFGSDTISMGTFTNPIGADDSSKYGAGMAGGYQFPGEDFINNPPPGVTFPADLSGSETFITIKPPYPKGANYPFRLIPFKTVIPASSVPKYVYSMENNVSSFPSGKLAITLSIYN